MVKCPNCGQENREDLKVCLHCGSNLPESQETRETQETQEVQEAQQDQVHRKSPKPPKEVKEEVSTEKTEKSHHGCRNLIIVLFLIFLLLIGIGRFASLASHNNSNDVGSLSAPSYYIDFDGLFTIDVDKNMSFGEISYKDYEATKEWKNDLNDFSQNNDQEEFTIYYWENMDASQLEYYINEDFQANYEDDLLIIDFRYFRDENNEFVEYHKYMACKIYDNQIVGVKGSDLDQVKRYAKSVKFT